jgi:hypothetical protein
MSVDGVLLTATARKWSPYGVAGRRGRFGSGDARWRADTRASRRAF